MPFLVCPVDGARMYEGLRERMTALHILFMELMGWKGHSLSLWNEGLWTVGTFGCVLSMV